MKLWSGRFSKGTDKTVEDFTSSLSIDKRLYKEDIAGSVAHAKMLGAVGIITDPEARTICSALGEIETAIEKNNFSFEPGDEDIHMAIERALIEKNRSCRGEASHGQKPK